MKELNKFMPITWWDSVDKSSNFVTYSRGIKSQVKKLFFLSTFKITDEQNVSWKLLYLF